MSVRARIIAAVLVVPAILAIMNVAGMLGVPLEYRAFVAAGVFVLLAIIFATIAVIDLVNEHRRRVRTRR